MGYEVKIFVGQVHVGQQRDKLGSWFQVWGMFDIRKPSYESRICKLALDGDTGAPIYFYGLDGNTEVTHDCYDKRLKAISLQSAYDALVEDSKDDDYRRYRVAADLLRSVLDNSGGQMSVVLYGY
jgi:hypothetical protein